MGGGAICVMDIVQLTMRVPGIARAGVALYQIAIGAEGFSHRIGLAIILLFINLMHNATICGVKSIHSGSTVAYRRYCTGRFKMGAKLQAVRARPRLKFP